ncbi:MAG: hypothetical protein OXG35_20480, partial [Acidobacteria bacterium]|nr:hypothetical protein [Acidobacteriota bacterium]
GAASLRGPEPPRPAHPTADALVLVTTTLAASFFPARPAAQADPRQALQAEIATPGNRGLPHLT